MARLGIFFLWAFHFLPLRLLSRVGALFGMLLYYLGKERREVAHTNLRLCLPELPLAARDALVRQHFRAFGRSFVERGILWWGSAARIQRLVQVEGLDHYTAARAQGAVILLVPHFVALDVGWSWLTQHGKLVSVYSPQKNAAFDKRLLRARLRFGTSQLFSRHEGLRPVVRALRDQLPFYYLPDQDLATKDGVFAPFFGVPAATLTTVSRLSSMTQARVVPCIVRMLPEGQGYNMRFYPAWTHYPSGDDAADAQRMNQFIEQRVLEMPEQYFWLHKRFKTRPAGEEKFY